MSDRTKVIESGGRRMIGRRLPDVVFGQPGEGWDAYKNGRPGDYIKVDYDGRVEWWIRDPYGRVGRLTTHTVTEHEDGTITVRPSIFDQDPITDGELQRYGIAAIAGPGWHGWLERGVWRRA